MAATPERVNDDTLDLRALVRWALRVVRRQAAEEAAGNPEDHREKEVTHG